MLLYETALLREEVAQFCKTNHILSRRRRTKNKRLQEGGILTVKEGQALLAEKEGGSKQSQLITAEGNCRKKVKTKGRKYSICGKLRHNTRTYQEVIKTFNEKESD